MTRSKDASWGYTCFRCLFKIEDCGDLDELQAHVLLHNEFCGAVAYG